MPDRGADVHHARRALGVALFIDFSYQNDITLTWSARTRLAHPIS
jgi:hypothetical protein